MSYNINNFTLWTPELALSLKRSAFSMFLQNPHIRISIICHFWYDIQLIIILITIPNNRTSTKNLGKMNRNFLKEAIADAKTVKESAIANAKLALEEAFQPQIKSMLAAKLEEMDKEEMDEEMKKDAEDKVDEAKKSDDDKMEEGKEYMTKKEKAEGDDRKFDNKAETETEKMRKLKEEDDSELNEILAELENELKEDARTDAEEEGYEDGMEDAKKDIEKKVKDIKLEEDERTDAEEEGYEDGMKDEKEDMEDEDEDIDLEDMSEEDLKKFIEDVIEDMVSAGEIEAGESFEDDVDVDVDEEGEIEVEDDMMTAVDVSEDKRTDAEEEGYKDGIKDAKADAKKEIDKIKLEEKDEELKEAYATVETLRSELNEINLLNAKLLYTNKIFKSKNLNESQKVKVLEAFDKAGTVKEAKLVFETVNSGFNSSTKKHVNENLGRASKSISTPKAPNKKPIVESDEMVLRFQKLAGIING